MYEEILGRPASPPEIKMLDRGFGPELKIGAKVLLEGANKECTIDGIVLFAIPPVPGAPGARLAWGFRVEGLGLQEFLPQEYLQEVKD